MRRTIILLSLLTLSCEHFPQARSTVGRVTNLTREPSDPARPKNVIRPTTRSANELAYVVYADIALDDWVGWAMIETEPMIYDGLTKGGLLRIYWSREKARLGAMWSFESIGLPAPDDVLPKELR